MTTVLGRASLRKDRVSEAVLVLQKALALHVALYDPKHSPAIARSVSHCRRPSTASTIDDMRSTVSACTRPLRSPF
jgi:hypothetical protein